MSGAVSAVGVEVSAGSGWGSFAGGVSSCFLSEGVLEESLC